MDAIKENSRYGWIGLYRSIKDHWIYPKNRPFTKYEAWIDLMLMVNHTDKKVFDGSDISMCERGQKITSQKKLMLRWGWSKSKLIKFLDVLKSDSMIDYKTDTKKTTIKVLNFINYQDFGKIEEIKKDHKKTVESLKKDYEKTIKELTKRLQKDTNNNDNKEDNDKNIRLENFKEKVHTHFEFDVKMRNAFIEYWTQINEGGKKFHFEKQKTFDIKKRLATWKRIDYEKNRSNNSASKGTEVPTGKLNTKWDD